MLVNWYYKIMCIKYQKLDKIEYCERNVIMLGMGNQLHINDIVNEIVRADITKKSKIRLLNGLMKYEGHNDDFSPYINKAIKLLNKEKLCDDIS